MALQRCEGLQDRKNQSRHHGTECRSRNNRAVYMVDGKMLCMNCFETWLEAHGLEGHRVTRLSDRDRDFNELARSATSRATA